MNVPEVTKPGSVEDMNSESNSHSQGHRSKYEIPKKISYNPRVYDTLIRVKLKEEKLQKQHQLHKAMGCIVNKRNKLDYSHLSALFSSQHQEAENLRFIVKMQSIRMENDLYSKQLRGRKVEHDLLLSKWRKRRSVLDYNRKGLHKTVDDLKRYVHLNQHKVWEAERKYSREKRKFQKCKQQYDDLAAEQTDIILRRDELRKDVTKTSHVLDLLENTLELLMKGDYPDIRDVTGMIERCNLQRARRQEQTEHLDAKQKDLINLRKFKERYIEDQRMKQMSMTKEYTALNERLRELKRECALKEDLENEAIQTGKTKFQNLHCMLQSIEYLYGLYMKYSHTRTVRCKTPLRKLDEVWAYILRLESISKDRSVNYVKSKYILPRLGKVG